MRSLLRRPAFTGSTILVLGLGIAASTTVYSFARAVLLRPLPYPDPDALVRIEETRAPDAPGTLLHRNLVPGDIERLRERATRLAGVAGFMAMDVQYADAAGARRLPSAMVDPHLFGVLGVSPGLGRGFADEDMEEGAERVAVLGHRAWIDRFGGAADVLGRTLELNYESHRVIGVMPPGFDFPDGAEVSSRALEREREVALRRSLGASPGRLARTVLLESLILATTGGALGFLLSRATLGSVIALSPADLPARDLVAADGRVALFATALAVLIGLAAGLVPALRSSRVPAPTALRAAGTGTVRAGGSGVRGGALIAAEVGMATLLVVGGGLLLHSFVRMLRVDTGLERLDLLTASVSLPSTYDDEDAFEFFDRLRRGALAIPGVTDAALSLFAPLYGSLPISGVSPPGAEPSPDDGDDPVRVLSVTPAYFRLVGIPVVSGRTFREADDDPAAPRVAIVSRTVAMRFWGEDDPIGRTLSIGDENARRLHGTGELRVVGVADDVRQEGPLDPPPPLLYVPFEQYIAWGGASLVLASESDPGALVPAVRDHLRRLDPRIPIDRIETIAEGVSGSVAEPRFFTVLVVAFAALASLVALAGLYGILAYDVRRRLAELGIRAVLGARPRDNVLLLLRRGALWVSLGIAGGVLTAVPLTGWLESLMYGIEPHDPATIAGAALLMLAVGIGVSLVPAVHATRADPAVAIRAD